MMPSCVLCHMKAAHMDASLKYDNVTMHLLRERKRERQREREREKERDM